MHQRDIAIEQHRRFVLHQFRQLKKANFIAVRVDRVELGNLAHLSAQLNKLAPCSRIDLTHHTHKNIGVGK